MDFLFLNLIPLLWLAWFIYWGITAWGNKANSRLESVASRWGHLGPIVVAALLLWLPTLPYGFLCQRIFPASTASYFVGVAILATGLAFTVVARVRLGRNWSGTVTLKQDHELIRSGPYAWVRHPIYTGLLVAFLGSAVARDEWRGVLAVVIVYLALWRKYRLEERWMVEQFGASYGRYRDEVPALIPAFKKKPR